MLLWVCSIDLEQCCLINTVSWGGGAGLAESGGSLVIQTLHPESACGELPYEDGWRAGSWEGFSEDFVDPAPWYFRTVESWVALSGRSGFGAVEVREPGYSQNGLVASLILVSRV